MGPMWLKSVSSPRQWGTVTLNSRNAGPLVRSRPRSLFVTMQEAELAWWKRYLDHPTARQRMWALYGARYYDFFWRDMGNAANTVEIGAGPVPGMGRMGGSPGRSRGAGAARLASYWSVGLSSRRRSTILRLIWQWW